MIFRSYFFTGFFFFPLAALGNILASNYNCHHFLFKFCDKRLFVQQCTLDLHPGGCDGRFFVISLVQVVLLKCVVWSRVLSNQTTDGWWRGDVGKQCRCESLYLHCFGREQEKAVLVLSSVDVRSLMDVLTVTRGVSWVCLFLVCHCFDYFLSRVVDFI